MLFRTYIAFTGILLFFFHHPIPARNYLPLLYAKRKTSSRAVSITLVAPAGRVAIALLMDDRECSQICLLEMLINC